MRVLLQLLQRRLLMRLLAVGPFVNVAVHGIRWNHWGGRVIVRIPTGQPCLNCTRTHSTQRLRDLTLAFCPLSTLKRTHRIPDNLQISRIHKTLIRLRNHTPQLDTAELLVYGRGVVPGRRPALLGFRVEGK